jgi:hypothetical protein
MRCLRDCTAVALRASSCSEIFPLERDHAVQIPDPSKEQYSGTNADTCRWREPSPRCGYGGLRSECLRWSQNCRNRRSGQQDSHWVIRKACFEVTTSNGRDRPGHPTCWALNASGSRKETGDVHWAVHGDQRQEAADGDSQPKPSSRRHAAKGVPTPKNH